MVQIGLSRAQDFNDPFAAFASTQRDVETRLSLLRKLSDALEDGVLNDDTRHGLSQVLAALDEALPQLRQDDEESLFPRLTRALSESRGGDRAELAELLRRLSGDHVVGGRLYQAVGEALRPLAAAEAPPAETRRTVIAARVVALSRHYKAYLAAKERELVPAARELIGDDAELLRAVGDEMRRRRGVPAEEPVEQAAPAAEPEAPAAEGGAKE
jgi:hypothetical protein